MSKVSDDDKIKKLRKLRSSMKTKLTHFESFLKLASTYEKLSDVHTTELECRLVKIESLYPEFDALQNELEELCDPPDEQYAERELFEKQYYQLVSQARRTLADKSDKTDKESSVAGSENRSGTLDHFSNNQFNLPKINIPTFNGSYMHWLEFRDTFLSMIHNNDRINNISKFHYLRASLQGSAAIIIKNIDFSDKNYVTAWNLLQERYNNPRLLVNNHVQALFNVEAITKESSRAIRYLLDNTNKNVRALTSLNQPTQHWDTIIIHMMSTKLDAVTSRYWEEFRNTLSEAPTLSEFTSFLSNRADLLETLEENKAKHFNKSDQSKPKNFLLVSNDSVTQNKYKNTQCPMCKGNHILYNCDKFRELTIEKRISKAKELKVCLNCLRPGHSQIKCRLSHCRYCRYKHSTLLHLEKSESVTVPNLDTHLPTEQDVTLHSDTSQCNINEVSLSTSLSTSQPTTSSHVLLSTALVQVYDSKGKGHDARLLLDNGSTANLITQELCSKLGLSRRASGSTVTGICNQNTKTSQSCSIKVKSKFSDYELNLDCILVPQITKSLPSRFINIDSIPIPTGIQLADPYFNIPAAIDILVGAETFWNVICNNSIDLGKSQPKLCETRLGWLISGYVPRAPQSHTHLCHFLNQDANLTQFWELDSIESKYSMTSEERACEEHFLANTYRTEEGRFVVTMPLKRDPQELGDSYYMAKIRFLSLERRFERDPEFKERYVDFIHEYEELGHMSENQSSSKSASNSVNYYLPHHGVLRESSTTTKLRTVFDASAITTSGLSLNDIQMIGPNVQDDLLSILIRFRQHKFVISGDIEKMYRAIEINPVQRPLQQILFRSDPSQPIKTYTLNTVTYGTASAPYLATKCLSTLANTVSNVSIKEPLSHDFYVDDYLSGGATEEEVIEKTKGIISVLSSAKFNLRKFQSNSPHILKAINHDDSNSCNVLTLNENNQNYASKTLGLHWICDSDVLSFSINIDLQDKITKRHILSVISQIFDPLGLVGAAIVQAKIIMQMLWKSKLDWDTEVPDDIKALWNAFSSKLHLLNNLRIPRWVLQDACSNVQLHIFTDASEKAYGACLYVRSVGIDGRVHVQLIASKNRVAPIKPTTMPRLELCGALVGARLCCKVLKALRLQVLCKFWCDSTIVLSWLQMPAQRLKPFVRNRVNEINELTSGSSWGYVPSLDNPADLVSRGVKADLISSCALWWSGPQYLQHPESTWPSQPSQKRDLPEVICHLTQSDTTQTHTDSLSQLIHKHSNYSRLLHTVAYLNRFIFNCKNKHDKITGHLTQEEIQSSLLTILKHCQSKMFAEEYSLLLAGKPLPTKNRLLSLSPFLDSNNIIRVGGRLDNSPYTYDHKHPVLLCSKHHITKLIFRTQHLKLLHAGPLCLLANIRQTYWPLGGRNLARQTVNKCVTCFRHKCKNVQPIMGQLPVHRTTLEFPFLHCFVDYAGPVHIADKKGRGCKLIKAYLCIFVCSAVKAVHLELVTELSKEAYLAALRRFISRRGKPQSITSDNGTNFVGACNELTSFLSSSDIGSDLADEGIKFNFTPPYSPHFNGLAESAVRSTKRHLKTVLNLTHFTYEEMNTCLTQIEAILNSRPISPMSTDPLDMAALTPAHFLIGRTLTAVPSPQVAEDAKLLTLQRYRRVEAIKQHFWRRFSDEYITLLQKKTKWHQGTSLQLDGPLVLVKDKTAPPLVWLLGRITKVYPGVDGVNRVAEIKTKKGTIRRGFNNICVLPADDQDDHQF